MTFNYYEKLVRKIFNRLKNWLQVRRYHIEGLRIEQEQGGPLHIYVEVNGNKIRITDNFGARDGDGITDFGIYLKIKLDKLP